MLRWLLLLALALVVNNGLAQRAGGGGETFKSKAGTFSVWLPAKPQPNTKKLTGPAGEAEVHVFSVGEGDRGYSVGYTDYPPGSVTDDIRNDLLDRIRDGSAAAVQGLVKAEKKITLGNVEGRDFLVSHSGRMSRSKIFLKGDRLYQLAAAGPSKEWIASPSVTKFFDSFAIEE